MKVHGIFDQAYTIRIRDTSCFCRKCFDGKFQITSCCKGWRECALRTTAGITDPQDQPQAPINNDLVNEGGMQAKIVPEVGDHVSSVYNHKPYIGQVHEIDEEDEEAYIHFLLHTGNLHRKSKFKIQKNEDDH